MSDSLFYLFPGIWIILLVDIFYYYFAMHRKIRTDKLYQWSKRSIETAITSSEFVKTVQKVCLHKKWNLVEISDKYATIRTNPSFWSWGMFFHVEFAAGTPNEVHVYARGAMLRTNFYRPTQLNLLNMFYKV